MSRAALTVFALLVAACDRAGEVRAVAVTEPSGGTRVGALVVVDAFHLGHCDLEAVAFPTRLHGYVRDNCGVVFGTIDGGRSFEAVDLLNRGWRGWAPFPLLGDQLELEWHRFPEPVRAEGAIVSIDSARRLLVLDGTDVLAIRSRGSKRERLVGTASSKFGLVAWTAHTVLSADGDGPLVARGHVEDDEIESVVHPFEREWVVRTKRGSIVRSRKQGSLNEGEDRHALVAADDFDRWQLERSEHAGAVSPFELGLRDGGAIEVSLLHANCSDDRQPVTYTLRSRHGAPTLSVDAGAPRALSTAEAVALHTRLVAASTQTAVPTRWSYGSQTLWITITIDGRPPLRGRYTSPSPLASAVLRAFDESGR